MIYNIIKYTIGLPFLLIVTFVVLFFSFVTTIIQVIRHILSFDYILIKDNLTKEYLIDLWRPIK